MVVSTRKNRFLTLEGDAINEDLISPHKPKKLHSTEEDSEEEESEASSASSAASSANPPLKKQKPASLSSSSSSSILFQPYLTVGNLTTSLPPSLFISATGPPLLTCALNRSFTIYAIGSISPSLISPPIPNKYGTITCLTGDGKRTYIGTSNGHVLVYDRVSLIAALKRKGEVKCIEVVGNVIVAGRNVLSRYDTIGEDSDDEEENMIANDSYSGSGSDSDSDSDSDCNPSSHSSPSFLDVYSTSPNEPLSHTVSIPISATITTILHPPTFLNKMLVATTESLLLYNVRSTKLIHTFKCLPNSRSPATLTATPDPDTLAVSTDNLLHLINLKHDSLLFTLTHEHKITSVAFAHSTACVTTATANQVFTWDLTERTLLSRFISANTTHTNVLYIPNTPQLIVTGLNDIKVYQYDNITDPPRLLKGRSGHKSPPLSVSHLKSSQSGFEVSNVDAMTGTMLTMSDDGAFRMMSAMRSVNDCELSQGQGLIKQARKMGVDVSSLKLPPVIGVATCPSSINDYGDIVTIHRDHAIAYVWSSSTKSQSGCVLKQPLWSVSAIKKGPGAEFNASCVEITSCGNYALVGTTGGSVFKYNVQSAMARGEYPNKEVDGDLRKVRRAARGERRWGERHRSTIHRHPPPIHHCPDLLDAPQRSMLTPLCRAS